MIREKIADARAFGAPRGMFVLLSNALLLASFPLLFNACGSGGNANNTGSGGDGATDMSAMTDAGSMDATTDADNTVSMDSAADVRSDVLADVSPCEDGFHICGKHCEDIRNDPSHCGSCENDCTRLPGVRPDAVTCVRGVCVVDGACMPGRAHCTANPADGCETDVTTPMRCGNCTTACAEPTPFCTMTDALSGYRCSSGCAGMTSTRCNGLCVNIMSDTSNCGACGRACPMLRNSTVTCEAGGCTTTCAAGFHLCGGACLNDRDIGSCGMSCTPCPTAPANGMTTCNGTDCNFTCNVGFRRCVLDGAQCLPEDSPLCCESDFSSCPAPRNGRGTCMGRRCDFVCNPGFHRCDTFCMSDTDASACGSSCIRCPDGPRGSVITCEGGSCRYTCTPGYQRCGSDCVDTQSDMDNCGACGNSCRLPGVQTSVCSAGRCIILYCADGMANCDGMVANGCEVALASNTRNCGRCGTVCADPTPTCRRGECGPMLDINISSSCGSGTVQLVDPVGTYRLGSGWCYYLFSPSPMSATFDFTFRARMLTTDEGYGVWFGGDWNRGDVRAPAIQYEPYVGAAMYVYPATESRLSSVPITIDYDWHAWEIRSSTTEIIVLIDGSEVLRYTGTRWGNLFGFRTWRGRVEVTGFRYL